MVRWAIPQTGKKLRVKREKEKKREGLIKGNT
jgi:hypothetical protein